MNKLIAATIACSLLGTWGVVQAADVEAGKAKSAMCAACHGADGNSASPMYPKIAGQHAAYLESSLQAYKAGQRTNATAAMMTPMVAALSDADIANLAAFYAAQAPK